MKLEINVDETMFKDVLEKELKAFSEKELHDILRGCIIEFFNNNDNIKNMFLEEKTNYWGGENHVVGYEPSGLLKRIVRDNFDYDEPYKEVRETLIEYCKKDGTLKNIIKEMIADAFKSAFTGQLMYNCDVRSTVSQMVYETIMNDPNIPKIQH